MNQPLGRPCVVTDCINPVTKDGAHNMCGMHYQRWRRHGSADVVAKGGASLALEDNPNWSGDAATYQAVHLRLRHQRGPARNHPCIDCGKTARHWAYDNSGIAEQCAPRGWRYSTDLTRYEPRCVPCHRRHDDAARIALLTGERK